MEGVVVAKLVSREFVIARLMNNSHLFNVFLIRFEVDKETNTVIASLLPYMAPISMSAGIIISLDKIIAIEKPTVELVEKYIRAIQGSLASLKATEGQKNEQSNEPDGLYPDDSKKTGGPK